MLAIGQVKLDSLDMKQPIKPEIRAVNNQSYSNILLFTQLHEQIELDSTQSSWQLFINITFLGSLKGQEAGERCTLFDDFV